MELSYQSVSGLCYQNPFIHRDSLSGGKSCLCQASKLFLCMYLQNFYLWKKDKNVLKDMKEKEKELLLEVRLQTLLLTISDTEWTNMERRT